MKESECKVAIINCSYEDASGGSLTRQLHHYAKKRSIKSMVFYGRGKVVVEKDVKKIGTELSVYIHKILSLITGRQGFFSNIPTNYLIKRLKENAINVVILIQTHGYYLNEFKLLKYLKENKTMVIYVTPDEYAGLGKCCYSNLCDKYKTKCHDCPQVREYPCSLFFDTSSLIWWKKKEAYNGLKIAFIGPETNIRKFRESSLLKDKPLFVADWGIDTEKYSYCYDPQTYEKYSIPKGKTYILTVAPYSLERKGVKKYFFEVARKTNNKNLHFINVGYDGNPNEDPIPSNMTTIGYINNQEELVKIYSIADLYVLASTQDTMPLSCLIAFACETPVCCFYTSGMKYLADKNDEIIKYVYDVDVEHLEEMVSQTNKKGDRIRKECRNYALNRYSTEIFSRKVFDLIEQENWDSRC